MSDTALATSERNTFSSLGDALETAAEYVSAAGATAGASVKSAAAKTGEVAGVGAYKTAYGLSFGLVFGAVFLKELLPAGNALRRGFEDGADAAFDAVEARKSSDETLGDEIAVAPKRKAPVRKTVKATASEAN
ncbi:hypothetical protein ACFQI3_16295 [Hansschlegelia quercus]|uniref:Uncharacterized protein n=1 Tax=Hansschlegelia quercus TaxID=2528245 RepID=A0A4Q9GNF2_9HYPH|nr:hypothetical protein [Hansschlegelia quercus]TBN52490.1 hypothetical protein EYR15_11695 [Hansschlegelia quercus]